MSSSQTPAGWYADPSAPPGQQGVRWWDGARWTEHVHAATAPSYYTQTPDGRTTTPDGQPLAGWGRRLGAYLIDSVITGIVTAIVGFPFVHRIGQVYVDFIHDSVRASENGTTPPDTFTIYGHLWQPFIGLAAVTFVVGFAYHVGFLRWRGATPAKLMLGMRVRLRDHPGPLPWRAVLLRWLTQFGVGLLGVVPFVGTLTAGYSLLDGLWPLWDAQRQAIHDKAARTNVVLTR